MRERSTEYINRMIEDIIEKSSHLGSLVTGSGKTGKSTLLRHMFTGREEVSFDDSFIEEQAKTNGSGFEET